MSEILFLVLLVIFHLNASVEQLWMDGEIVKEELLELLRREEYYVCVCLNVLMANYSSFMNENVILFLTVFCSQLLLSR